ncbi:MAG TPA: hypothetical protein VE621_14140 [Bryobacteraceae bacterium]|nr:hypothetical protein [Bryobacteraceae bacterium]
MTKVQVHYELLRPLDDALLANIARAHGVYGIERIILNPGMTGITVEYDASRLNAYEVENVLHRAGIPVAVRA